VGVGEALDLRDSLADLLPLDPEALGQLVAQVGLVDVGGGRGVVIDCRVVEPRPFSVGALSRVGYQDVGMELGIAVAGGAVAVGSGEVAVALDELRASGAAARPARLALHVGEGGLDSFSVGSLDFEGGEGAAEAPEQGDRLGSREGEVEAGDRAVASHPSHREQGRAIDRIAPGQHRRELVLTDLAFQAEVAGGVADPFPGRLAFAGVVVLGAFGDLVEVMPMSA
jgi:hypothetical protein